MITPKNQQELLRRLDEELRRIGEKRELVICGGAALIVSGVIERQTRDIDVLTPEIDRVLEEIAEALAHEFGLAPNWLNNGPASLAKDLSEGWKNRTTKLFVGKNLEIEVLGRLDLLATKLYAFCDREDDLDDVLRLKPTNEELVKILPWVLERDGSDLWPKRVATCFQRVRKMLGHE